jgi:hypothetical protein
MSIENEIQEYEKLIQLIRDLIQQDSGLREKYAVAEKFRFVRDRLNGLLTHLEEQARVLKGTQPVTQDKDDSAEKTVVYVYLYNAQGAVLRTWLTLLTPRVFYEYSINRPVYSQKNEIESMIRAKSNKQQHGYLAVKINKGDVLPTNVAPVDAAGNALLKIREGSLRFENLVVFSHNGHDYVLSAQGELVKK